jgi:hypothetical protein
MNPTSMRRALVCLPVLTAAAIWPAHARDHDFPGNAPCNATLQACIDLVAPGDRINLLPGAIVNDPVDIRKSITLMAAASSNPPRISSVGVLAVATDVAVTVQGLSIRGSIFARTAAGGGALQLRVLDNVIDAANSAAVELTEATDGGAFGRKSATISGNTIRAGLSISGCSDGIRVYTRRSATVVKVSDNRIVMPAGDCSGISAYREDSSNLDLAVERNEVRGSTFAGGIRLRDRGATTPPAGRLNATIYNNVVAGQSGDAGFPGAITANAEDSGARLSVQIVNNTIAGCRDGIGISERRDANARVEGHVANNIVAACERIGIAIAATSVSNSHNLLFGNGMNLLEPGPGTRDGDPKFADLMRGDLRLTTGSDAVDVGDEAALPAQQQRDIYGQLRRVGQLDIGAAEAGFLRPPEPVPAVVAPAWLTALAMLLVVGVAAAQRVARKGADRPSTSERASCTTGTRQSAPRRVRRAR